MHYILKGWKRMYRHYIYKLSDSASLYSHAYWQSRGIWLFLNLFLALSVTNGPIAPLWISVNVTTHALRFVGIILWISWRKLQIYFRTLYRASRCRQTNYKTPVIIKQSNSVWPRCIVLTWTCEISFLYSVVFFLLICFAFSNLCNNSFKGQCLHKYRLSSYTLSDSQYIGVHYMWERTVIQPGSGYFF